jgi:hypothetical protein
MNVIVAKYIEEKLENLMQTNGLIKSKRKFESNSLFAIPYKDGLVYAPKGCRWNFGEDYNVSCLFLDSNDFFLDFVTCMA